MTAPEPFSNIPERLLSGFQTAFEALLGENPSAVGQTPSEIVYAENKLRLIHYLPVAADPARVPVLVVPSFLYRYTVLDLVPGASLVGYLVERGLDVYLVDWSVPGREERYITFDQYITGLLRRVVHRVRRHSKQDRISLLGYSLGGTMTAIFTALHEQYVANLVQLAAPVNFHDEGVLSQWTRKGRFNVDLVVDTMALMPIDLMRATFRMFKPTTQIMHRIALATQLGDGEGVQDFMALQRWYTDDMPYLGEAYRQIVKELYQENSLVQGKLVVDGRRVDLGRIVCPLLIATARGDPLCPPSSATVLAALVSSSDKELLEAPGGHIGAVAGKQAAEHLWPVLARWLAARSQEA
jgi:polyhydroxyalkanoate synthase subunit PhaC